MINLLPSETIVANQRRYRQRRWLVLAFASFFLLLLVVGVTGYFTWVLKLRAVTVEQQLAELKKRAEAKELIELERNWRNAERQIKGLASLKAGTQSPASMWAQLLADKPAGIALKEINYTRGATSTALIVEGVASTRKNLLAFLEQLRADKVFNVVDSPVGNLIKDRQAEFVINLEVYEKE